MKKYPETPLDVYQRHIARANRTYLKHVLRNIQNHNDNEQQQK